MGGGSGSSKFVRSLDKNLSTAVEPIFVPNIGDNFWHYGLYICPDVDITLYALSSMLDKTKGWGIAGDTMNFVQSYAVLCPEESWFNLGDRDLSFSVRRTELLKQGYTLSEITNDLRKRLKIRRLVMIPSNDSVETFITTPEGTIHLQEFWVKNRGVQKVLRVSHKGAATAKTNPELAKMKIDSFLLLPANPISSIVPTISLKDLKSKLRHSRVVAISPFVGRKAFSGPAAKFMRACDLEPSSFGVAKLYSSFLKTLFVDLKEERQVIRKVSELGIECVETNIMMRSAEDEKRIVNEIESVL